MQDLFAFRRMLVEQKLEWPIPQDARINWLNMCDLTAAICRELTNESGR